VSKKVSLFVGLSSVLLVGIAIGTYAQSGGGARLAALYETKADISKMDLVLLNTRISVLEGMLKDDLSVPFAPTSFYYDYGERKITIAVQVDPTFIAKTSPSQLSKAVLARASALCVAPQTAQGNLTYMLPVEPPKDYCIIKFFTYMVGPDAHTTPKDVAVFEDGKLTMR
jgi:hypothetical protein